jgi:hypothetical protein
MDLPINVLINIEREDQQLQSGHGVFTLTRYQTRNLIIEESSAVSSKIVADSPSGHTYPWILLPKLLSTGIFLAE